jgi:NAD(P)-dependent dehydrogenase (short-subunit alcohol dehydrogenase family)
MLSSTSGKHDVPKGKLARVKEPSLRGRVLARDMLPVDRVVAVAFFRRADSAFITGQSLVVDGGAYDH